MKRIGALSIVILFPLGLGLGSCGWDTVSVLPPLQYEGEHVRVGTDFDTPICGGTLADFDNEIERLDATLELESEGKTDLWILADGPLYELFCANQTAGCEAWDAAGGALVRKRAPAVLWHALAHDRVLRAGRKQLGSSNTLFVEGMSEALARTYCEPSAAWEQALPDSDSLLAPGSDHADFTPVGVSVAGHMLRWMLGTYGPQQTQIFMTAVARDDPPDVVRAAYTAQFGGSLDEDLYAHIDWTVEGRHPYEVGCRGEAPPVNAKGNVYTLQATLDCSSKLVRSNFYEHRPEKLGYGYVEWALEVETGGFYQLVGELPGATQMTIARCDCQALDGGYWPDADPTIARPFTGEYLSPGLYRVVWKGQLDSDHVLDVQIARS